ncbi:hypothetical protein K438DRAFT_1961819 [Mycena galopus ATCC 62051]|nr:hypothetical protein K438DRAFT_1961819 [Mycena galopus ATCC 62051]
MPNLSPINWSKCPLPQFRDVRTMRSDTCGASPHIGNIVAHDPIVLFPHPVLTLPSHAEERRQKNRERMACLRATATEQQRENHQQAQGRYRERFRESIAHWARRAAVKKNAAQGKETKLRPKARQYWSDPELASSDEEEEDDNEGW